MFVEQSTTHTARAFVDTFSRVIVYRASFWSSFGHSTPALIVAINVAFHVAVIASFHSRVSPHSTMSTPHPTSESRVQHLRRLPGVRSRAADVVYRTVLAVRRLKPRLEAKYARTCMDQRWKTSYRR